jgi:RNA polymerase sigma factor (sigma-70 family)
MTDAELAKVARGGDRKAFTELVDRYYRAVYALAYSRVGDWSAAEDLAQETFLVAYANLRRLRVPTLFPMWLRRITRNLCSHWVRSEVYRRKLAERLADNARDGENADNSPTAAIARSEQRSEVWEALRTLSPTVREAMVLYYVEGQSTKEAARALGVTENAVRRRLYQGRRKMREYFEKRLETELKKAPSEDAKGQIAVGLALGPAVPQIGRAVAGGGAGAVVHHLCHGGASALLKPVLTLALAPKVVAGTGVVVLIAAGLYIATIANSTRSPAVSSSNNRNLSVADALEAAPLLPEPSSEPEPQTTPAPAVQTEAQSARESEPGEILDPARYCSICGTVTDEQGNPVPGVWVIVIATGYESNQAGDAPYVYHEKYTDRSHHFCAITDPWGRYAVTDLPYAGVASVHAHCEGYAVSYPNLGEYYAAVLLTPGEHVKGADIALRPGLMVKGRVRAPDGTPVTDATVCTMGAWNAKDHLGWPALVYTDEYGCFRMGALPKVEFCNLEVRSETYGVYTFTNLPIAEEEIELWMRERSALAGTVTHADGTPAAGLQVHLRGLTYTAELRTGGRFGAFASEHTAVLDGGGRYSIREIDPGQSYDAIVTTQAGTVLTREYTLDSFRPGESAVWDCVVYEPITIRGRVLGESSGRALADVRVRCLKDGQHVPNNSERPVGDNGWYEFHLLTGPGNYLLYPLHRFSYGDMGVLRDRYLQYGREMNLKGGEDVTLDLACFEPYTLCFRVVDVDGNPVQGARMTMNQHDIETGYAGPAGTSKVTDENGRISWAGFEPGNEAQVAIEHPDYVTAETAWYIGAPGEVFPEETIVLYEHAGVAGMAADQDGNPIANAAAAMRAHYGDGRVAELRTRTDDTGAFSCAKGIPATEVMFEISLDDGVHERSWTSEPVRCVAGHIMDLNAIVFPLVEEPADSPVD